MFFRRTMGAHLRVTSCCCATPLAMAISNNGESVMFSNMKKTLAYFSAFLLIIGLAAILSLPRLAPAVKADAEADPLEGTWRVTVKSPDGSSFHALFSFARGGVMMESDEAQLT